MALKAPFSYFGGKSKVANVVWSRLGDVPNYVEPFFGSGAILLARPFKPGVETVNDADALLCNFWRSVQADPLGVAEHADWPVSECDLHARHLWLVNEGRARAERMKHDPEFYDVQVAGWWVWGICQWIGGGWCSGEGPHKLPGQEEGVKHQIPNMNAQGLNAGVAHQMPKLATPGEGVNRPMPHLSSQGMGIHRKMPRLADAGVGTHRKIPRLGNAGTGIHRHMTELMGEGSCDERLEYLALTFQRLCDRLRNTRIVCGHWDRILGPSPTTHLGLTGVFLDPPYMPEGWCGGVYAVEDKGGVPVAVEARNWAIENGDNPELRIVLCGYEGEHKMPDNWTVIQWKATGGYGSQGQGRGRENAARERLWFSPHCINPSTGSLDLLEDPEIAEMYEVIDPNDEADVVAVTEPISEVPWYTELFQDREDNDEVPTQEAHGNQLALF